MSENEQYLAACQTLFRSLADDKAGFVGNKLTKEYEALCEWKQDVPLLVIKEFLGLDSLQYFILLCSVLYEIDMKFANGIEKKYGSHPFCFQMILDLYQKLKGISYQQVMYGWIHMSTELLYKKEDATLIMNQQFSLHREVLFYILNNQLPLTFGCIQYDEFTGFRIFDETYHHLENLLEYQSIVQLQGFEGNGRTAMAIRYALTHERICMVLDMHVFTYAKGFLFTAVLQNACMCIRHFNAEDPDDKEMLKAFQRYQLPVILCVEKASPVYPYIQLPERLSKDERAKFENVYPKKNATLPSDFIKERGEIAPPVFVSCQKKKIHFEDVILNDDHIDRLHHILYMMQHNDEMQLNSCLSILFHGPSGTGKTMCAQMLANEADKPLWKVNLSMILDKYVGESEKHLEELFHKAQQANCILLFDEADVLFAKRTGISSSNDRYANTSTAYLLQKMESYQGILILTTNFIHNFDDAFLRRMQYILRFPEATSKQRLKKWEACFQGLVQFTKQDYEQLNCLKDISLASIETIREHAIIFWKRRKGEQMEFEDIKKAVSLEYEKLQKRLPVIWL